MIEEMQMLSQADALNELRDQITSANRESAGQNRGTSQAQALNDSTGLI